MKKTSDEGKKERRERGRVGVKAKEREGSSRGGKDGRRQKQGRRRGEKRGKHAALSHRQEGSPASF